MAPTKKPAPKKPAAKTTNEPEETKRQKFIRLANKRVNTALAKIKLIGNLAGPGYEKTDADIEKISEALNGSVKDVLTRLQRIKSEKSAFTIGDAE